MISGFIEKLSRLRVISRLSLALKGFGSFWVDYGSNLRRLWRSIASGWVRQDRRFVWWRVANYVVVGVIVAGVVIPALEIVRVHEMYRLNADAVKLAGKTDPKLAGKLEYDESKQMYQFNKDIGTTKDKPADQLMNTVGSPEAKKSLYGVDVPKDMRQGVTYHDANLKVGFGLKPEFAAMNGRARDGRIVFPLKAGGQAVYTLKNNGLKEDIVFREAPADRMRFNYKLDLPGELAVRPLPDGSGGVGVYSGDPALFGDVSYGSDADRTQVEQARTQAEKNNLVFGLPAPVIKAAGAKGIGRAKAHFELNDGSLTVVAEGLKDIDGAFTIDPSVVVTSTSDFQTGGNNEGMIDFNTSGQITRGGLTGATVGSWTSTNSFSTGRRNAGSVVYNGYLYLLGGTTGTNLSDVQYASINSNGTIGSWNTTTSLTSSRSGVQAVAYNGFMYVLGGSASSVVEYASINSNGTLGSWAATTSFTTGRGQHGAVAYNGNLYVFGGYDGSGNLSDVQYAPLKADGTVGSWTSTTSLTSARREFGYVAYNGYLYVLGGYTNTRISTVQYAKFNADGTIGSWLTATGLTASRNSAWVTQYNGYLYVLGGNNAGSPMATVEYSQINANGSLGSWAATTSFTTARDSHSAVAYNGYLYVLAGNNGSGDLNDVQYVQMYPAGQPAAFGTLTNNFTTARALSCSVAYNGYLYNIGGSTDDSSNNNVTTVQYTALNSSTGNNGSWSSTTSLPAARGSSGCVAHNGYLYVVGGYTGSGSPSTAVLYIAINSNGTLGASWTTGTSLPGNAIRGGVFTYGTSSGPYIYVLSDGAVHTAVYAPLNVSTGAVGSWTDGNNVINTYGSRGYAQVGKYLYAFGGYNSGTAQSAVEYTSINNDGTLNAWASTTGLNTAIGYTNGTTVNGCIYSVGGESSGGTSIATVQYACPAANGTISAWYNAPSLTVATTDLGVTSYNGYIYGVGGYTTSAQTTTQFAYVNNGGGGDVGSWSSGSTFTTARYQHASTAYNGYIYVAGGHNSGSSALNDIQYAPLTSGTGAIGSFTTDSSHPFTTVRMNFSLVAYNGYMYVMGGSNAGSSTFYKDTQYASIGSSGALSASFTAGSDFDSTGRESPCAVAYNGYMYVGGGLTSGGQVASVRYAAINSDGSFGTWGATTSFGTARYAHSCFVANGYFYVMGGTSGSANYNDVQSAPINSNGTLGSFTYTKSFNTPRGNMVVGVANGFVYIAGGCTDSANDDDCTSASSALTDVQYAPVLMGGGLADWQSTTALGAAIGAAGGVVYGGYLYSLGGDDSTGTATNTTRYAPINAVSRTARYSKLVDLGYPVSVSSIAYNGVLPNSVQTPGVTPIYFRAAGSNGVFGNMTAAGAITGGATACLATSQNYVRYLEVTVLLDDSGGSAIFSDAAGTFSNVTDFTVNFITPHPAPNIRLKLGRTLQASNLSPYDTCTP